jgi:hypothetical protein
VFKFRGDRRGGAPISYDHLYSDGSMECHRPDQKSSSAAEDASTEIIDAAGDESIVQWIRLTTGKEFSRILYPNPVCFLSTSKRTDQSYISSSSSSSSSLTQSNRPAAAAFSSSATSPPLTGEEDERDCTSSRPRDHVDEGAANNIMVLSWVTPTNNQGRFVFSINKSRYSASLLAPARRSTTRTVERTISTATERMDDEEMHLDNSNTNKAEERTAPKNDETERDATDNLTSNDLYQTGIEFTLSVPVRGMEQLVLDVGSISGRRRSKFLPTEGTERGSHGRSDGAAGFDLEYDENETMSVRKRKKLRRQRLFENGVTGLIPIPLGYTQTTDFFPFAIEGTVAHLLCRTYAVIGLPHSHSRSSAATNGSSSTMTLPSVTIDDEGLLDHGKMTPIYQHASPIIDDDHFLVLAVVTDAYVHPSYWDDKKSIFRPLSEDVPPYMTFLGSQTFG